jgi:hypothetical protein
MSNGYANIVYTAALAGTVQNPGLPATLAQLVTAQAQHETGNFTSNVFINANNAFGYKYVGSHYQLGAYHGYGVYADVGTSTAELVDWIYRRVNDGSFPQDLTIITDPTQYAALLKNASYYEASFSQYSADLASYFNSDVLTAIAQNPGQTAIIVLLVGLGVYLLVKNV